MLRHISLCVARAAAYSSAGVLEVTARQAAPLVSAGRFGVHNSLDIANAKCASSVPILRGFKGPIAAAEAPATHHPPDHAFEGSQSHTEMAGVPGGEDYHPLPHPSLLAKEKGESYLLMHPVYTRDYVESIKPVHRPPQAFIDHAAYYTIQIIRGTYDFVTGYGHGKMTKKKWLRRVLFLETVAGVPGMVGGMIRHLHSLRLMRRDFGWIHTLLEEAENERMHLLTFLQLKNPGFLFRAAVLGAQGIFCNVFFLAYLISPTYCHRLVGYLEEEAVKTYTHLIDDLEHDRIPEWVGAKAPDLARHYWRLEDDASMRDLILAVRADEACHSHVNHTFANMRSDEKNPFTKGAQKVP